MRLPAIAALAAALFVSCAEDPPKFLPDDDGSPAGGENGEGGEGAGGRAGSTGDAGETGDAGAPSDAECEPASAAEDCAERECYLATCVAGRCEYEPADPGTACGAGAALFCNGAGDCVECFEDAQCESEGPCSIGDCGADGTCVQQLLEAGETCDDGEFCNGDELCDGRGGCLPGAARCAAPTICNEEARQCVGCVVNLDCPAQTPTCNIQSRCVCTRNEDCAVSGECRTGTCNPTSGACEIENAPAGMQVGQQTAGDCLSRECNGSGVVISDDDDTDEPPDPGGGCLRPACQSGNAILAPRGPGTRCGDAATECSQADTCNGAGDCQVNHVASGEVVRQASTGDCRRRTCNGSGSAVETPINGACDDGAFCTGTESCSDAGVCQATGNPCTAPRPHCMGTECRACLVDAHCAGLGLNGRTGRCVGGTCRECTDPTVSADCGGPETGCVGGTCRVTCDCRQEACGRSYSMLCSRG